MKAHARTNDTCALCQCRIKENALFTGLTESQLEAFKDVVTVTTHLKRDVIFMEGDECRGIHIVKKGRVKLQRSSRAGKEQIIKLLGPGDILGLEVFCDAATYRNDAVAMEPTELCHVERRAFFRIVEKEPDIARKLILGLGAELAQAYERIGTLGLLNARGQLAQLLHTLASEYGEKSADGVHLNLTLSRIEIAALLGITQETSIRLLKSLKEDGILDLKRKQILIKSMPRLKELGE